jgi:hypothetical protein
VGFKAAIEMLDHGKYRDPQGYNPSSSSNLVLLRVSSSASVVSKCHHAILAPPHNYVAISYGLPPEIPIVQPGELASWQALMSWSNVDEMGQRGQVRLISFVKATNCLGCLSGGFVPQRWD